MKKTFIYWITIVALALSLGILTGCVHKEQREHEGNTENIIINNNAESEVQNEVKKVNVQKLTESEARKVVKEKFDLATEIYDLVLFDYDSSEAVALADYSDSTFYIINNFDEVTKVFTENEKKDLINNHGLLYTHDGQYYVMLGGIATYFSRADITDVYIEAEKIIATYSVDVSVAEEIIVKDKEITFTVVLEDNKWLIDSYVSSIEIDNELNVRNQ